MNTDLAFSVAFGAALVTTTSIQLWLCMRHIRHVQRHRNTVPEAFARDIGVESHAKAADYTVARTRLASVDAVWGSLVVLAFTLGGGLDAIAEFWARSFDAQGYAHGVLLVGTAFALGFLADLPVAWHRRFVIDGRFGFNRATLAMFLVDRTKAFAIAAMLGVPLLLLVLWLMARMGPWWWLYASVAWIAFKTLLDAMYPAFIAPLFNKFRLPDDVAVQQRITAVLARCGIEDCHVYLMDGSRRSSHGNAYFTGMGASRRIVVFDTLFGRLTPAELEAVLAHEMGHLRRHHLSKRMVWSCVVTTGLLALLGWLSQESWFAAGLGVTRDSTAMSLVLFFIAVSVFGFPFRWIGKLYSRRQEFEADDFAAAHSSADDLARALVKLYDDSAITLTPDPLHSTFYDTHPPAALRVMRLRALPARKRTWDPSVAT
jgi:STE24 endopeptidase